MSELKAESKAQCPKCGGEILVGLKNFRCRRFIKSGDQSGCNFILWRNDLERLGKDELSDQEVAAMLRGEEIALELVSPKSFKIFACTGKLGEQDCKDGKIRWRIIFTYPDVKVLGAS